MASSELRQAYAHCRSRAYSQHYENFPVASWLLPRRLRNPIAAIYCFARTADDLADEGDCSPQQRLQKLDAMGETLDSITRQRPQIIPADIALADTIYTHSLPIQLFHDLLKAFRQDVITKRYADHTEVLAYCRYSANPIGRLLLHLFQCAGLEDLERSDAICTALQLINFLQDLHQDYEENDRIYLPADEMRKFGVNEAQLGQRTSDPAMVQLLDYQLDRIAQLLEFGAPLGLQLKGRAGLELRLIICGGITVFNHLRRPRRDLFNRPRLSRLDGMRMIGYAVTRTYPNISDNFR